MVTSERMLGRMQERYAVTGSIRKTAALLGVDRKTVAAAIKRRFKRVTARKRQCSDAIKKRRRALVKLAKTTKSKGGRQWPAYGSAPKLRAALRATTGELLSVRQIQRELRQARLTCYVRPTATTRKISEVSRRREFAAINVRTDWKRIIFSDESWLTCNEATGKYQYCEKRSDVLPREKKARWNVPSVMVWAAVGYNYKSSLVILPSKHDDDGHVKCFRLDAQSYVRRCLSTVVKDLIVRDRLFQQDGARSHVAKSTRAYLRRKRVQWIENWPPYSADMNMIEPIWKELADRVGAACPMTTEELIVAARAAWQALPQSVINAHCKHFRRRMSEVLSQTR